MNKLDVRPSPIAGRWYPDDPARLAQMAADRAEEVVRQEGIEARERQLEEKRRALEAQVAALRAEFDAEAKESEITILQERARDRALAAERQAIEGHRIEQRQNRRRRSGEHQGAP